MSANTPGKRSVHCVLSPRSWPYFGLGVASLFQRSHEPIDLTLITDRPADKEALVSLMSGLDISPPHLWRVADQAEADGRAADQFAKKPGLQALRRGHPCWRKLTDPFLFARPAEEVVILDPDVYFPNRFSFEQTADTGLALMWQRPSCLWPPSAVRRAMSLVPLAHHVDIGVAHYRREALDLDFLDWLATALDTPSLPRLMHIEAILWAALAIRMGGGHLDPKRWRCWHRTAVNRILRAAGVSGVRVLAREHWPELKAFHAGGQAKEWIPDAHAAGAPGPAGDVTAPGRLVPYVPLTRSRFELEQRLKGMAQRLGLPISAEPAL